MFQNKHFFTAPYYGKATVVFRATEQELVSKSQYFTAYGADFKPLPCYCAELFGSGPYRKIKDVYLSGGTDFYIIADKGTIGFDSMIYVSKVHVKETNDEFIVRISLETNEDVKDKLFESYAKNDANIEILFHENFFGKINEYPVAPVPVLVKKAEETPFLNVECDTVLTLTVDINGLFRFTVDTKGYQSMDNTDIVKKGGYMYARHMNNSVVISRIQEIAHSVFGYFYAVIEPVYVYPRDAEMMKAEFPEFYKEHCITNADLRIKEFIGNPEVVSFIPMENSIGDSVIYLPLNSGCGYPGISNNVFQFTIVRSGSVFGDYSQMDDAFIRVEREAVVGTLIQVDGRFKILLYKCTGVVKYKDEYYISFKYDDESQFFNDFSSSSKNGFIKNHHRSVCRNVEYLLCREKITPVIITKEKFDSFVRSSQT